jgi:phage shock protein A
MSLLQKILTLFRGTAHEAGQAVVDKNALKILDQEIRDAGNDLVRSKEELTKVMAQRQLLATRSADRQGKRAEYENYIAGALRQGNEALAREVAERLATVETDLKNDEQTLAQYDGSIRALKQAITETERKLARVKQQVDTVKATEAVQRAQGAVAARHSGANGKVGTALDSLERIQARQAERGARMQAAAQLEAETGDNDLDAKLASAGLLGSSGNVDSILDRFREKPAAQLGHDQQVLTATLSPADADRVPRE